VKPKLVTASETVNYPSSSSLCSRQWLSCGSFSLCSYSSIASLSLIDEHRNTPFPLSLISLQLMRNSSS